MTSAARESASSQAARRPRKVLHVFNSAAGGAALSTLGLIESFRREGISACAVCHDAGSEAERQAIRAACEGDAVFATLYWWNRKIRAPLWKRPFSELRQGVRTGWARRSGALVREFARRHQVDLIHTNTIVTPEGALAARALGLPHVWHLREMLGPGQPYRLSYEGAAFGRYMARHCSKLVANSTITANQVRSWVNADLLEVVPNGIDVDRFRPKPPAVAGDRVIVGMVGNLTTRWKKHALLVEAALRVDRKLPIEWRIYGHDPSRGGTVAGDRYVDALHARLAGSGIADRFRWPGFVADPADIMAELDVLVHPADNESFGRVVVEAMAAGLCVVGVRGGGVAEIVVDGRTGLLAPVDDPAALATHIERVVQDAALRAELGRAGRLRAEKHYSLAACTARMLEVYAQAIERPLAGQSSAPGVSAQASTVH